MTAGLFVGIALLGAGLLFWGYLKLRAAGVIGNFKPQAPAQKEEITIIETEYEVVEEESSSKKK